LLQTGQPLHDNRYRPDASGHSGAAVRAAWDKEEWRANVLTYELPFRRLCDRARRSRNAAPSRLTPSPAPIARVEQDTFLSEHGGEAAADFFKNVLVGSMLALAPSFVVRRSSHLGELIRIPFLASVATISSTVY
jgi:hypothetical protein